MPPNIWVGETQKNMDTRQKINTIVNDNAFFHTLLYLNERWEDECRYESFSDYEAAMKIHFPNKEDYGVTNIEGTQDKFGCRFSMDGHRWHVYLRFKDNSVCMVATLLDVKSSASNEARKHLQGSVS